MFSPRTFLSLSRAANLPTVWSNCLAGWWLGGHENAGALPFLFFSVTFLYMGGAFLNDAFDASYDNDYRRTRPIPGGAASRKAVLWWGVVFLALGALLLIGLGTTTAGLGLGLVVCILIYNALHRLFLFSPALLGICRFFLYPIGAAVAAHGLAGMSIWCGLALAAYVTGLGCFLRWDRTSKTPDYWAVVLLAVPVFLALLMNAGEYRQKGILLSAILVLWVIRTLRHAFWPPERDLGVTASGLQAGIVFVDWLAVADVPRPISAVFIALFLTTLALQRLIPVK
jgi:4-hydroxybenzoate polyprenyltransferase